MSFNSVAKVAVEKASFSFDREFDYLVPEHLTGDCEVGRRVLVPFGRGNSRRLGIITSVESRESAGGLKEIISVPDSEAVMPQKLLGVARFMKEHYFCTFYDAVKTMLPAGVNYRVTTVYGACAIDDEASLSDEQQRLYDYLRKKRKPVKLEKILSDFGLGDSRLLDEMTRSGVLYKSDEAFRKINDAVMKMAALNEDVDFHQMKQMRLICFLFLLLSFFFRLN